MAPYVSLPLKCKWDERVIGGTTGYTRNFSLGLSEGYGCVSREQCSSVPCFSPCKLNLSASPCGRFEFPVPHIVVARGSQNIFCFCFWCLAFLAAQPGITTTILTLPPSLPWKQRTLSLSCLFIAGECCQGESIGFPGVPLNIHSNATGKMEGNDFIENPLCARSLRVRQFGCFLSWSVLSITQMKNQDS